MLDYLYAVFHIYIYYVYNISFSFSYTYRVHLTNTQIPQFHTIFDVSGFILVLVRGDGGGVVRGGGNFSHSMRFNIN